MRGKVYQDVRGRLDEGITPAYAGKSNFPSHQFGTIQDHPRVCGEKIESTLKKSFL